MRITQRRRALTAEITPGRVQAMQSKIFALYSTIEDAAKQYCATGKKPATKLRIGAIKHGR